MCNLEATEVIAQQYNIQDVYFPSLPFSCSFMKQREVWFKTSGCHCSIHLLGPLHEILSSNWNRNIVACMIEWNPQSSPNFLIFPNFDSLQLNLRNTSILIWIQIHLLTVFRFFTILDFPILSLVELRKRNGDACKFEECCTRLAFWCVWLCLVTCRYYLCRSVAPFTNMV